LINSADNAAPLTERQRCDRRVTKLLDEPAKLGDKLLLLSARERALKVR